MCRGETSQHAACEAGISSLMGEVGGRRGLETGGDEGSVRKKSPEERWSPESRY